MLWLIAKSAASPTIKNRGNNTSAAVWERLIALSAFSLADLSRSFESVNISSPFFRRLLISSFNSLNPAITGLLKFKENIFSINSAFTSGLSRNVDSIRGKNEEYSFLSGLSHVNSFQKIPINNLYPAKPQAVFINLVFEAEELFSVIALPPLFEDRLPGL